MRDYVLVAFLLCCFPVGILRPYFGLLVYTWVSFMYPHMLTWSFALNFPAAKLTAISAPVGAFLNRTGDTTAVRQREAMAMIFLWCTFTISTFFAFYPNQAWVRWEDVSKAIIMALVSAMFITTKNALRYYLLVIGLSLGFYA